MKNILVVLLGIASVASAFVIAPGAARAGSTNPDKESDELSPDNDVVQTFRNQNTNRCIDDTDSGFRTWPCNGTDPQKWIVHQFQDGTVRFQNVYTRRCIYDANDGFRTVTNCDSSTNESWYVAHWGDGSIRLENQATQRCMDDTTAGFRTWAPCNSTPAESWF